MSRYRKRSSVGLEAWRCSQSVSRSITRRKKSGWWGSATSPGESHLGFLVQISMVAVQGTEDDPLSYWGWESFNYCRCLPEAVAGPPSAGIFAPWWAVCGCPVQNHSRDPEWEGGGTAQGGPQPRVVRLWHRHSHSSGSPHFLPPS